jgi:hypothetical protein
MAYSGNTGNRALNRFLANQGLIQTLDSNEANIADLQSGTIDTATLNVVDATIVDVSAVNLNVTNEFIGETVLVSDVTATTLNTTDMNATNAVINDGEITTLTTTSGFLTNADITNLYAANGTIPNATLGTTTMTSLVVNGNIEFTGSISGNVEAEAQENIEQRISANETDISQLQVDVSDLSGRVFVNEVNIEDISQRLFNSQAQDDTDISDLSGRVFVNEVNIEDISQRLFNSQDQDDTDISDLSGRVFVNEVNIEDISQRLFNSQDQDDTDISDLSGRVFVNEGDISDLGSFVTDISNDYLRLDGGTMTGGLNVIIPGASSGTNSKFVSGSQTNLRIASVNGQPENTDLWEVGDTLGEIQFGAEGNLGGYRQYPASIVGVADGNYFTGGGQNVDIKGSLEFRVASHTSGINNDSAVLQPAMKITHDGKVGIATLGPTEDLDVSGTIKALHNTTDTLTVGRTDISNAFNSFEVDGNARVYGELRVDGSLNLGPATVTLIDNGDGTLRLQHTNGTGMIFDLSSTNPVIKPLTTTHTDSKVLIDNTTEQDPNPQLDLGTAGRVGIGTNSPTEALTVSGNIEVQNGRILLYGGEGVSGGLDISDGPPIINEITSQNTIGPVGPDWGYLRLSAGGGGTDAGGASGPAKSFIDIGGFNTNQIRMGINSDEKVRILSNGNMGIGTKTPAYKLDVSSGSISTTGSVITNNIQARDGFVLNLNTSIPGSEESISIPGFNQNGNLFGGGVLTTPRDATGIGYNMYYDASTKKIDASRPNNDERNGNYMTVEYDGIRFWRIPNTNTAGDPNDIIFSVYTGNDVNTEPGIYSQFPHYFESDINIKSGGSVYVGGPTGTTDGFRFHYDPVTNAGYIDYDGPNSMNFRTNDTNGGSTRMVINVVGNVGIGTTNPGYKLDVNGDIKVAQSSKLRLGSNAHITNANDLTDISSTNDMRILGTSDTTMYLTHTGNVGIGLGGNNTPQYKLDVSGDVRIKSGNVLRLDQVSETNEYEAAIRIGSDPDILAIGSAKGYRWIQSYGSEPLSLNPGGNNVGIGTTTPAYKLDVGGNARIQDDSVFPLEIKRTTTSNGAIAISIKDTENNEARFGLLGNGFGGDELSGNAVIENNTQGKDIRFNTRAAGGSFASTRMTITENGNVGIGTLTPQYKLDVNGDIRVGVSDKLRLGSRGHIINNNTYTDISSTNDIRILGSSDTTMYLTHGGAVGIGLGGNNVPGGGYRLDVSGDGRVKGNMVVNSIHTNGSTSYYLNTGLVNSHYLLNNGSGSFSYTPTGNYDIAGYFGSGYLLSAGYINFSDSRLKHNIKDISDGDALGVVRKLKPVLYNYIDQYTSTPVYGFIAQEVKDILPYAISLDTRCIPDYYKNTNFEYDTDYIYLDVDLSYDLSEQDKINVYVLDTNNYVTRDTYDISITETNKVKIINKFSTDISSVFLYGKEIDDVHTLKKDAIWTVATAALQEVDRSVEKLRKKDHTIRGTTALSNSTGIVILPLEETEFTNPQIFLQNNDGWSQVKGSLSGNTLTINAKDPDCTDTIDYMVVVDLVE